MDKKLYKSNDNKFISGVFAGISETYNIDVTILRLIYTLLTFFTFGLLGIVVYVIFAFVMPEKETGKDDSINLDK